MRVWTRALLVGAAGLLAGGPLGCAEERAPINKVQPNALAKSFFVGDIADPNDNPEFWAQGTVIDVGYGAAQDGLFTSTYAQPVSRIKWQLTEDLLIGRLAYERIEGSDGKEGLGNGNPTLEGQIAYIYPIQSHFDIRRDYNPTTGEESNVVVENTADRPWDQREFVRVDWSRNLNTDAYDYDTLSLIGIYGGVSYEPISYYVNDPEHADAPEFSVEDGYFDVTNKALATPGVVDLSHLGWGIDSFPACFLENDVFGGSAPSGNCNPVEITIRQAFRKVVDDDFEPQHWDGLRFQAFGAFYVERSGYSREYGMVDDKWKRLISRYTIWQRSHYYENPEEMTGAIACNTEKTPYESDAGRDLEDMNGDGIPEGNGTDDECEAVTAETGFAGSRCDVIKQKCTLPYQARVQKPVVWNYTKNSNQEFYEGTEWATNEWDVAMRVAVQTAKYAECTRVKVGTVDANQDGLDDACAADFPVYSGQQDDNQDAIALAVEVDACRYAVNPFELSESEAEDLEKKCRKIADDVGAVRGYQPGVIAIAKMPEMVVLCHGPVEAKDPAICGKARLPENITAADCDREWSSDSADQEIVAQCNQVGAVRIGDMRYHQVNVIKNPQTPSPWGIYTDSEDPLSGAKIAASINIWSHVNTLWATGVVDMVRYMQGELPTEEITDGKYVQDWVQAEEASRKGGAAPFLNRDQVDQRLAATAWQASRGTTALSDEMPPIEDLVRDLRAVRENPQLKAETSARMRPIFEKLKGVKFDASAPSVNRAVYEQRRKQVHDTATEAAIMTPAMQQLTGVNGVDLPESAKTEFASIFRGLNPEIRRDIRQAKETALAARGACIMQEAPTPNSMAALSSVLTQKFGDWNAVAADPDARAAHFTKMRKYLEQRAQYAVIIHEMGHSVGLRHNFVSSSNAWGYRPQYWQLRTKNGTVKAKCDDLAEDGATCNGPRYFDPPTAEETDQLQHMFMQSSVMDYAGENTQDLIGLGAYDFAAARMFYGDVMSVHAEPDYLVNTDRGRGILNITDSFGGIVGYQHASTGVTNTAGNFIHYSQLQEEYGLLRGCTDVGSSWDEVEAKFKPSNWNDARDGRWHPVVDGQIVAVDTTDNGVADPTYSRCRQPKVDYVAYDRMRIATSQESEINAPAGFSFYGEGRAIDPAGRTRVPYAFATDSWADLGNLAVYRHDNGADAYEIFNFFITEQETRHIFDNYRRGRQSFSVRGASGRILGRYNEKMRDGAKGLGLYFNLYREFYGLDNEATTGELAGIFPDNLIASGMAFDHFTRQIQRPQSGSHVRQGNTLVSKDRTGVNTNLPTAVNIPDGATGFFANVGYGGKLLENRLASGQGEYDRDYTMNAGSYYDKVYAPYLLTESVDNFISDSLDDFSDARYRSVSMTDLFPLGFRRMLGTMLSTDDFSKGAFLAASEAGAPQVDFQSKFPVRPLGWTSYWTAEPEVCFPANASTVCATPQGGDFGRADISNVISVGSNVDWEQWKFLVVQTMMYLPENSRNPWINQLGIWEIGADTNPEFENRIELHSPEGSTFVAKTSGMDSMMGKSVQAGIAARVLQNANELLFAAYDVRPAGPGAIDTDDDGITDAILDENEDGVADRTVWWIPVIGDDGSWTEKSASAVAEYQDYEALLTFIRQTMQDFRMADPTMKGIYN